MPRLTVNDPRLFVRKLVVLFLATVALAPLIVYKMMMPASLYVGGLVLLHVFVLAVYIYRTPWREIWRDKVGLVMRVAGVVFFGFLLTLLHFEGDIWIILTEIAIATLLHALIIAALHVRVVRPAA